MNERKWSVSTIANMEMYVFLLSYYQVYLRYTDLSIPKMYPLPCQLKTYHGNPAYLPPHTKMANS